MRRKLTRRAACAAPSDSLLEESDSEEGGAGERAEEMNLDNGPKAVSHPSGSACCGKGWKSILII